MYEIQQRGNSYTNNSLGAVTDSTYLALAQRPSRFSLADTNQSISDYEGTPQTVAAMINAAKGDRGERSLAVRRAAEGVVSGLREKDYNGEIAALYYWVCAHKRYTHDPTHVELVKDPLASLEEIQRFGKATLDCDDLSTLLAALLMSIGVRVQIVTVDFKSCTGQDNFSHVFTVAQDPKSKTWLVVDPVAGPRTAEMLRRVKCYRAYSLD